MLDTPFPPAYHLAMSIWNKILLWFIGVAAAVCFYTAARTLKTYQHWCTKAIDFQTKLDALAEDQPGVAGGRQGPSAGRRLGGRPGAEVRAYAAAAQPGPHLGQVRFAESGPADGRGGPQHRHAQRDHGQHDPVRLRGCGRQEPGPVPRRVQGHQRGREQGATGAHAEPDRAGFEAPRRQQGPVDPVRADARRPAHGPGQPVGRGEEGPACPRRAWPST